MGEDREITESPEVRLKGATHPRVGCCLQQTLASNVFNTAKIRHGLYINSGVTTVVWQGLDVFVICDFFDYLRKFKIRPTDRQTADRQTNRQTERQTDRQTDRQRDIQTDIYSQNQRIRASYFLCLQILKCVCLLAASYFSSSFVESVPQKNIC